MSQTKAQILSPVGILTVSGVSASGIVTATAFVGDLTGDATDFGDLSLARRDLAACSNGHGGLS